MPKITDYEGVEIFVNEKGSFYTEDGLKSVSLSTIKKKISERSSPVIAYEIYAGAEARKRRITSFDSHGYAKEDNKRIGRSYDHFFIFTPEQLSELEEIRKEYLELEEKVRTIKTHSVEVTQKNFSSLRNQK
jgi:hypothetical protein